MASMLPAASVALSSQDDFDPSISPAGRHPLGGQAPAILLPSTARPPRSSRLCGQTGVQRAPLRPDPPACHRLRGQTDVQRAPLRPDPLHVTASAARPACTSRLYGQTDVQLAPLRPDRRAPPASTAGLSCVSEIPPGISPFHSAGGPGEREGPHRRGRTGGAPLCGAPEFRPREVRAPSLPGADVVAHRDVEPERGALGALQHRAGGGGLARDLLDARAHPLLRALL